MADLLNQIVMESGRGGGLARTLRLRDVVGCAERQRLEADLPVAAGQGRGHDDDEVALPGQQLRQRRNAVELRHFDVEHGDVRIDAFELVDGVEPRAQRSRDLHVRFGVDPARDHSADDNGIIHYHDADRLLPRRGGGRGTIQRNTHTSPTNGTRHNGTITPKAAEPPDRECQSRTAFFESSLFQINPTSWNFAVTMSLSKGFIMYSLAPACSARAM